MKIHPGRDRTLGNCRAKRSRLSRWINPECCGPHRAGVVRINHLRPAAQPFRHAWQPGLDALTGAALFMGAVIPAFWRRDRTRTDTLPHRSHQGSHQGSHSPAGRQRDHRFDERAHKAPGSGRGRSLIRRPSRGGAAARFLSSPKIERTLARSAVPETRQGKIRCAGPELPCSASADREAGQWRPCGVQGSREAGSACFQRDRSQAAPARSVSN